MQESLMTQVKGVLTPIAPGAVPKGDIITSGIKSNGNPLIKYLKIRNIQIFPGYILRGFSFPWS
jgi:hypothetical protein